MSKPNNIYPIPIDIQTDLDKKDLIYKTVLIYKKDINIQKRF